MQKKKKHCDSCGADMSDENGEVKVGRSVFYFGKHPQVKRVQDIFGRTEFYICPVCDLKAAGIKPLEEKNQEKENGRLKKHEENDKAKNP